MKHAMRLQTSMPLQMQCLVEHFDVECRERSSVGIVVADWSAHHLDQHASRCVASYTASKHMNVHPSVYYASSHSSEGVQVADLVAAVQRRCVEGDGSLRVLRDTLHGHCQTGSGLTAEGRPFTNQIFTF